MLYFIEEKQIPGLLKKLTDRWEVYAPIVQRGGDTLFERIDASREIPPDLLDMSSRPLISPKEIFFPQSEVMFKWRDDKLEVEKRGSGAKPRLVFGVKPCDFYALQLSNSFFTTNIEDYYYVRKFKGALFIVTACLTPPEPNACFCSSTGTGPYLDSDKVGFDLQFVKIDGGFIVEVASARGEKLVKETGEFFKEQDQLELSEKLEGIFKEARENINLKVDFETALEIVREESEKPLQSNRLLPIYNEIANRCIYCGACLYACPTCTCFNVYDTSNLSLAEEIGVTEVAGERVRVWDGCVFSGYTREASGHNPREKAYIRTARRYEHKLRYDVDFHGRSGCVGCGRCLSVCPVDMGMSAFVERVNSLGGRYGAD